MPKLAANRLNWAKKISEL